MVSMMEDKKLVWRDVDSKEEYELPQDKRMVEDGKDVELAVTGVAFDYLVAMGEDQDAAAAHPHLQPHDARLQGGVRQAAHGDGSRHGNSVVDLCREGRCSVATSLTSVQPVLRLFQYYHAVIMSQWCWVLADGSTLVRCSCVIALSKPLKKLQDTCPMSSRIGSSTPLSFFGQKAINVIICGAECTR
ncbi:P-type ATPase (P-ATPase) Superfamily [Phytophthora cinnamomi]|uniref:P-type ATPase (P-ATPase) Superfamily n=1 Tax=Phytophthora cinnamomi TaxID=4785 RepID=UPI00355957A5|nr:P-type ATPase (P-ATPase) Superfamily [Phytophthora cinnamomi]KAG6623597.1 P-type ATPase (P-ATPase) Superfamily [Phytophthora cinnamomi]